MDALDFEDVRAFCDRGAVAVARALLGCHLSVGGAGGVIVETEAYSADDPASHSFRGLRAGNASMFGAPGTSYVYRIYGLHHCLNIVSADAGAVLLRALEPDLGVETMQARRGPIPPDRLCRGPGNLCAALGIDLRLDGLPLDSPPFALLVCGTDARNGDARNIVSGPRIGISRNTEIAWRFGLSGSPSLSRRFAGDGAPRRQRREPR